ncbi:MAG: MMPL family transporter [Flavobacteriales bacterium]|nr:MMPL family transporter [Flavobacteriales bacterium]MBT5090273.1 MMPL family transporter [Flavobacteriales bacterium]
MPKLLPIDHPVRIDYQDFLEKYGEQNVLVIAIEDSLISTLDHLSKWDKVNQDIEIINGVDKVISFANLPILLKDTANKKFVLKRWFSQGVKTQEQLDSAFSQYNKHPFYKGLINSNDNKISAMLITLDDIVMKSASRKELIFSIKDLVDAYADEFQTKAHFSGLPYIRTVDSLKVREEISLFIIFTLLITSLILFLFFRSFKAVISSMIVVMLGVIFSFGTISLLDYEVSVLMALIPPVLVVIGIPNCIFLINKFHTEFKRTQNKDYALRKMIQKIGNITLLTNLTTASGFAAFLLTNSETLQEFGLVASINILIIFLLSLFIIPIYFSFASPPKHRHTKHLDKIWINQLVEYLVFLVQYRRKQIYFITTSLIVFGVFGILNVKTTGNLTDELPKEGELYKDLKFFESNFGGVMPLEVLVNTKKKNGLLRYNNLRKIEQLSQEFTKFKEFSKTSSYVDMVKYSKQAFYNGDSAYYSLPNSQEQRMILSYLKNSTTSMNREILMMDSLKQEARISLRVADISTTKMDSVFDALLPKMNKIFDADKYDITITGSSVVFLNGTKFLLKNLILSLLLGIILISIFMAWMFNSFRMVVVSIIPNLIPLLFTGAIMGYFGIALKPSTILVFSIAFGISVDDTIHFLAKYRQELLINNWNIKKSVLSALNETGVSMFYTSVVLFFGFFIFVASDFGGTIALGLLVSITLLFAMLSNLLLLPALLLSLEKIINYEAFQEPLLDAFDEEEDIEWDELKVKRK